MTAGVDPDADPGAASGDRPTEAPATTGLAVEGLAKAYGDFRLGPLDLSVGEEVLAVLGPSGCGKTTLLSLVAGIATPDRGSVFLDGRRLDGLPPEDRGTGLVFQDGALFPHMTARENVAYAADDPARVESLAETFEIADLLDRRAAALSGGERQRVALARALAADPDVLLLDEPLANLDAPIRRRLREHLHGVFADLSIPVVYVTHDQRAATALGDRIAVMDDGTVEQVAPPETILERPATPFVAAFTGSENVFEADVVERTGDRATLDADGLRLAARTDAAVGATVTVCVRPSRIRVLRPDDPATDAARLRGTVARRINEGDHFRVTVDHPSGRTLVACVRPGLVDDLGLAPGNEVVLAVDPGDVHVIGE